MAAYIIANVSINNPTRYADYTALTPGIIKKYKGEFVVRGGPVESLEEQLKKNDGLFYDSRLKTQQRLFIIQKNTLPPKQ